ncbi:PEBP-like protein [Schizophyllum commune H4-8]|uniref:PEBP-like protein n=1 Tax=Schizophyllum commune (strain H4-8 / FGSC 9210) TaxID=578458 RepID=D8PWA5_SCHCM|nr:PEBP-like protein [Schizophyllum commune H4-8]KAI5900023.1 PEBP-like protein [Schizophyllum commune H4-8]
MVYFTAVTASLLLSTLVSAQSDDSALGIAAIKAHFSNAGLVPALLETFEPQGTLTLNFDGVGDIQPGQALSKDQVASAPTLTVATSNSSATSGSFTVAMVDADIVGADDSQVTRHWLVNSDTIQDNKVDHSSANTITDYAGPGPAEGSGAHRYVVLVYSQPEDFSPPQELSQPGAAVEKYDFKSYVSDSKLGDLLAANYFTVEAGTSTVTVSETSAVESSTLSAASSTGSGSGSDSASATSTGEDAASTDSNGAASFATSGGLVSMAVSGLVALAMA